MTTFNSLQVANYLSSSPLSNTDERVIDALFQYGKLRVLRFDWTSPAGVLIADIVNLVRIPQGKVTILGWLSQIRNGAFGGTATASIGYSAFRDKFGNAVAANATAILAPTSVVAAGTLNINPATPASGFVGTGINDTTPVTPVPDQFFETLSGVYLTATFAGSNPAASQVLNGGIVISVE